MMPTLLDYLGLKIPNEASLPGKSIAAELKGNYKRQTKDEYENIVIFDEYGPVRMIRDESWKYIHRYPCGPHELYDLTNDPGEKNNLVNEQDYYNQIINMRNKLENWFVRYADPNVDRTREAVVGAGQGDLAGVNSKKYKSYYSWSE